MQYIFTRCGKTKVSCGLRSGHIKFHKNIAIRSHLQVATTATFCTCSVSFVFGPCFSIFEQTSSFEFHMQLGALQQKAKVLLGTIWLQCRGYCFNRNKTNFNGGMYDEDLSRDWGSFGWTGSQKLQNSVTQILICSTNVISSTCRAIFRVAGDHDTPTCAFCINRISTVSTLPMLLRWEPMQLHWAPRLWHHQ